MRAAWIRTVCIWEGRWRETQEFAVVEAKETCRVSWKVHGTRYFGAGIGKYPELGRWRWEIANIFGQELSPSSVKGRAIVEACLIAEASVGKVFEPV